MLFYSVKFPSIVSEILSKSCSANCDIYELHSSLILIIRGKKDISHFFWNDKKLRFLYILWEFDRTTRYVLLKKLESLYTSWKDFLTSNGGLLTTNGPEWARMRKAAQKPLTKQLLSHQIQVNYYFFVTYLIY